MQMLSRKCIHIKPSIIFTTILSWQFFRFVCFTSMEQTGYSYDSKSENDAVQFNMPISEVFVEDLVSSKMACDRISSFDFLEKLEMKNGSGCRLGNVQNFSCDLIATMIEIANGCSSRSFGTVRPLSIAVAHLNFDVVVFGGSISAGLKVSRAYPEILHDHLHTLFGNHVRVLNYAVPASGPETPSSWLCCGNGIKANLFISEFALNIPPYHQAPTT